MTEKHLPEQMPRFFKISPPSLALQIGFGLLLGMVLITPSVLIPLHRSFYQRHFPRHAESWPNNGRFTHFAVYGGEGEDEVFYAARVKEASRRLVPFDPYIQEDRSRRLLARDVLGFMFLGALQRITGDLNLTWVFARLILIPFYFLLIYRLILRAGSLHQPAIFFATVLTLFSDLTIELVGFGSLGDIPKDLIRKSFWLIGNDSYFFGPTRLLNNCLTWPALLAAALLTMNTAEEKKSIVRALPSGFVGGLLAYVHTNIWGVYAVAVFIYWLLLSVKDRSIHWPIFTSGVITALLSCPWLVLNHPMDVDLLQRCAAVFGRHVSSLAFLYLATALALLKWASHTPVKLWCVSMSLAVFFILNLSLITGYNIIAFEWAFNANLFLLIVLGGILGSRLKDGSHWLWMASLIVLLGLCREVSYSAQIFRNYGIPRDYEEAFSWLDRNTPPDSVVASLNAEATLLLPVYTHNRTLVARNQPLVSDLTNEENADRLSYAVDLLVPSHRRERAVGILLSPPDPKVFADQMWTGIFDRGELDGSAIDRFFSGLGHHFTRDAVFPIIQRTLSIPAGKFYPVDYLWVGNYENFLMEGDLSMLRRSGIELAYSNPSVSVYRVERRPPPRPVIGPS